jgi:hypothetical protein
MTKPGEQRKNRAGAVVLVAIAVAVAASALAAFTVVMPALRAEEERQKAELQRAIRETPNYGPGYDPLAVVDEAEAAELAARVEQARRRAAEAELERLKTVVAEKEAEEERLRHSTEEKVQPDVKDATPSGAPSKRRTSTKSKSSQRQARPSRTLAEDSYEDPLTDWPFL